MDPHAAHERVLFEKFMADVECVHCGQIFDFKLPERLRSSGSRELLK
ncbi:hypothetical protein ACFLS1_11590 [Verrucomicrobiota bacterium]